MEDWVLLTQQYYLHQLITRPLVSLIVSQEVNSDADVDLVTIEATKNDMRTMNRTRHAQQASNVKDQLPDDLKRMHNWQAKKGPPHGIIIQATHSGLNSILIISKKGVE